MPVETVWYFNEFSIVKIEVVRKIKNYDQFVFIYYCDAYLFFLMTAAFAQISQFLYNKGGCRKHPVLSCKFCNTDNRHVHQ